MHDKRLSIIGQEAGIVSMIVTVVLMLVLSLIVLSFATLMRREQRQTLDRQLNTQAFYAAESGVNDAAAYLKLHPAAKPYDDCKTNSPAQNFIFAAGLNRSLDTAGSISYTCILVSPFPPILEYSHIGKNQSRVVPLIPTDSTGTPDSNNLQNIYISWENDNGVVDTSGCPANVTPQPFPASNNWLAGCSTGMLRVDLVEIPSSGQFNRANLSERSNTFFLYPTQNNTGVVFQPQPGAVTFANQVDLKGVRCSPGAGTSKFTYACRATINVTAAAAKSTFYLRLKSIYVDHKVSIAADDATGAQPSLSQAQTIIDSTGKANDVLKRIQVRLSTSTLTGPFPEYPIQSLGSLCKRFGIAPPDVVDILSPPGDAACNP
jgi:hypothetical protein